MSTKVSKIVRKKMLVAAAAMTVLSLSAPAHAGWFGHSKKWKEAQAAAAAAQAAAAQAAAPVAAPITAPAYQPAQPVSAPQTLPSNTAFNGQPIPVDQNGVPLFGADGKPLSDKDKALYPFLHQAAQNMPILITQPEWTPAIEDQFSSFVAQFGVGVKAHPMRLLNFYMHDASTNPFVNTNPDPAGTFYYSDCADLPYFLRSYFAYKMGLPMSIAADAVMNMQPFASLPSAGNDAWSAAHPDRTDVSPYGNSLTHRAASNIPSRVGAERNYINYWGILMDVGSTRTFMVSPFTPNYSQLSDVYPVSIDSRGVRAGTLVHSDGHMLIVTMVHPNGDVELIDAHPDNSLQFKTLDPSKLMRDRPDRAYGFFRFRPTKAVGGQWLNAANGQSALYGAKIVSAGDQELYAAHLWSVDQWMGPGTNFAPNQPIDPNQWKRGYEDTLEFFYYVRGQLAVNVEDSADASGDLFNSLCNDIQQRVSDVVKAGQLPNGERPTELPKNIYNASGAWEQLATPSRDARFRQAIANLPTLIRHNFRYGAQNKYKLSFPGSASQFQQAVTAKWAQLDNTCKVTYRNSAGLPVTIGFSELVQRAPRMSFDYADCPEKRWGASDDEIARTCKDQDTGNRWFKGEQSMRNGAAKTNDNGTIVVRSDRPITLDMLEGGQYVNQPDSAPINLGFSRSQQPNVKAYLSSPQFIQDLSR